VSYSVNKNNIVKRYIERPMRPWKIWFFDVSKQILSAITIHFLNLLMAFSLSDTDINSDDHTDECVWYFLNVFVDTIVGTFICYGLLRAVNHLAERNNLKDIQSGLYYEMIERNGKKKARMQMRKYFYQLVVWILIVISVFRVNLDENYYVSFY
jgi:hypothetical protein